MAIIVIYGPPRTGKTMNRDRFAGHYRCKRIRDTVYCHELDYHARDGDLILSNDSFLDLADRFPRAELISINAARRAIGLDRAPARGFPV